jgi:hypothetical protein
MIFWSNRVIMEDGVDNKLEISSQMMTMLLVINAEEVI